jgi:hypothetical protein
MNRARFVVACSTPGCESFCVTTERDPKVWTCPTCEDLALEDHLRYLEALSLTRSTRHTQQESVTQ